MSDARAESIKVRLLNGAQARVEEFNLVLARYALERWLYRLSVSDDRLEFMLKGGFNVPPRTTRDGDLLGLGAADATMLRKWLQSFIAVSQFAFLAAEWAAVREAVRG